ncbi:TIGR03943 family protein [Saccharopolyspora sp. HNM0983]|uniref:TIGR03943 family protein n=1 Tax=Saccharopolyspora montiporae TaxID=2781240 RepID=A0A929BAK5_9PSEU|nr:TIGR03943 family protein [Saccharopolyspora sp. HNM0983]MBE9374578.1 TIGR03943 family protein [Saccharopolyspora sp. HNM0983]
MRRETQNLLLLLLGGALLKLALAGDHVRYVKDAQLPWLLGAGGVMMLLALLAIARDVRAGPTADAAGRDGETQHAAAPDAAAPDAAVDEACGTGVPGHAEGSRSTWMLLLPVFAIFLIAPPALGSDSVRREQAVAPPAPEESRFPPLPSGEAPELSMSEYVTRAVWGGDAELAQRPVRLRGFVVHPVPGETQLARMRISCCAADATAVRVDLTGPGARRIAEAPADAWFEVTGTARPGSAQESAGHVPEVRVSAAHPVPEPAETYEY